MSFSNPCATFALGVHIFLCSKWHNDSTKKRLFAGGIIFLQLSLRCGDNSHSQIVYACVDNLHPTILLMPTNWSDRIHHTIILKNDRLNLSIIPYGITMSKITLSSQSERWVQHGAAVSCPQVDVSCTCWCVSCGKALLIYYLTIYNVQLMYYLVILYCCPRVGLFS